MLQSTTWHASARRSQRYARAQAHEAHEILWSLLATGLPLRTAELRALERSANATAETRRPRGRL